jgi:hypothetical protein
MITPLLLSLPLLADPIVIEMKPLSSYYATSSKSESNTPPKTSHEHRDKPCHHKQVKPSEDNKSTTPKDHTKSHHDHTDHSHGKSHHALPSFPVSKERKASLTFEKPPTTKSFNTALLCGEDISEIVKIEPFMPEPHMNHGSSPTSFKKDPRKKDCLRLSKISLFMPGLWHIRVFYKDKGAYYFELQIKEGE